MGIFRRKGKADKGKKEDLKQQEEPAAPRQPYKPKHAAADAVPKAVTLGAHGQRVSKQSSDYAQGGDRVQNPNGFSGASASLPPYRGMNGGLNVQRNSNAGVFTTDPNAPPLPTPTPVHNNPGQRRFIPINGTGWFGHQKEGRRSTERHLAGNSKSLTATKDKGHGDPHLSSDSGYGSDGYSRAPSEYGFGGQDTAKPGLLQESAAFLPEMSLSDELAREPAWSEASFAGDDVVVTPRAMEERRTTTYFSQLGPVNDARTPRPSRSSKSIHKQARFDDTVETEQQRIEPHIVRRPSRTSPPSKHLYEAVAEEVRPESSTLPSTQVMQPSHGFPLGQRAEHQPGYAEPVRHSTPSPHRTHDIPVNRPMRLTSPPPSLDHHQVMAQQAMSISRLASPALSQHNGFGFNALERMVSNCSAVTGSLEGYKVNKRGKILDEEGEVIGELVEGDIMDCVRQRCNAYGDVLDDRGRIVGRVQAIESGSSPITRIASPPPSMAQDYQPMLSHQLLTSAVTMPSSPVAQTRARRMSAASQLDIFTPAWQRQAHHSQSGMVRELQEHLIASSQSHRETFSPVDASGTGAIVELGSGRRSEDEEVLPLFDHSEIFMPTPYVPPRSPMRASTPTQTMEKHSRMSPPPSSELQSIAPDAEEQSPQRTPENQARHILAPVSNIQQYTIPNEQPQGQSWSSGTLVEQPVPSSKAQPTMDPMATTSPQPMAGAIAPAEANPVFAVRAATAATYSPPDSSTQRTEASRTSTESAAAARAAPAAATASIASPPSESAHASKPVISVTTQRAVTTANASKAQSELQTQNGVQQAVPVQHQPRKGILRTSSDSSVVDMAKSYIRPSMSPVQEDAQAVTPASKSGNSAFAYKGDIPAEDGSANVARLAAPNRVKSPPLPAFPRQAFGGGLPTASPFAPINSAQFSGAGGGLAQRGLQPRQFNTGVPNPRPLPPYQPRPFNNTPFKRSPLSSTRK